MKSLYLLTNGYSTPKHIHYLFLNGQGGRRNSTRSPRLIPFPYTSTTIVSTLLTLHFITGTCSYWPGTNMYIPNIAFLFSCVIVMSSLLFSRTSIGTRWRFYRGITNGHPAHWQAFAVTQQGSAVTILMCLATRSTSVSYMSIVLRVRLSSSHQLYTSSRLIFSHGPI